MFVLKSLLFMILALIPLFNCLISSYAETCTQDSDCHFLDQVCQNGQCLSGQRQDAGIDADAAVADEGSADADQGQAVCEVGERVCNNSGGYNLCVEDGGKSGYSSYPCEDPQTCDAGYCVCSNPCTGADQKECLAASQIRKCTLQPDTGCYDWQEEDCVKGFICKTTETGDTCQCKYVCTLAGFSSCQQQNIDLCGRIEGELCYLTQTCGSAFPAFNALSMTCQSDLSRCVTSAAFQVNQYTNTIGADSIQATQMPDVAPLENGGFVIVWQRKINITDEGDVFRSFYRVYQSNGNPLTSEQYLLNEGTSQVLPKVAGLKNGGFVIAAEYPETARYIKGRLFDANGGGGNTFIVSGNTPFFQKDPYLIPTQDGGFVILWRNDKESNYYLYFTKFDSNGSRISTDKILRSGLYVFSQFKLPKGFELPNGDIIVTYQFDDGETGYGYIIWGNKLTSQGNVIGGSKYLTLKDASTPLQSISSRDADHNISGSYDIEKLSNNRFVIVWSSTLSAQKVVLAKIFDANFNAITSEIIINKYSTTATPQNPTVSSYLNETFIISWEEPEKNSTPDILARWADNTGAAIGGYYNLVINESVAERNPASTRLKSNALVVVWADFGSFKNISFRIIP